MLHQILFGLLLGWSVAIPMGLLNYIGGIILLGYAAHGLWRVFW
jgi:hypothetical protein